MAGKILSKRNLNSLKKILSNTAQLLISAGENPEELTELVIGKLSAEAEIKSEVVQAGLSGDLKSSLWRHNFGSVLEMSQDLFGYAGRYGESKDNQPITEASLIEMIDEFVDVISEYLDDMPKYESLPEYTIYCQALAAERQVDAEQVAAGAREVFEGTFAKKVWRVNCEGAFSLFRSAIDDLIYNFVGTQPECVVEAKKILAGLKEILIQKAKSAPVLQAPLAAEALQPEVEETSVVEELPVSETAPEAEKVTQIEADSQTDESDEQAPELVQIAASSVATTTEEALVKKVTEDAIAIACSSVSLEASAGGYNNHPFSGVLLRVDEISDSPPGLGPKTKLFVPMQAAVIAASIINASGGLPLDVRDDLSGHNDLNITGVMTSAEIRGKDFHVSGHLFPINKPQEVAAIAANKEDLGMSINASAQHHPEKILNPLTNQEETVAYVDRLTPSGANILLSQLATWTSTKVLQAQASTDSNNSETSMNNQEQNASVSADQLKSMLDGYFDAQKAGMNEIKQSVETLQAAAAQRDQIIAALKADKDSQDSLIAAQKAEEAKKTSQAELAAIVAQTVKSVINPTNSPRSLTATPFIEPLAAGNSDVAEKPVAIGQLQTELIAAQATYDALAESNVTGPQRIKASDKLKRLQRQAAQAH